MWHSDQSDLFSNSSLRHYIFLSPDRISPSSQFYRSKLLALANRPTNYLSRTQRKEKERESESNHLYFILPWKLHVNWFRKKRISNICESIIFASGRETLPNLVIVYRRFCRGNFHIAISTSQIFESSYHSQSRNNKKKHLILVRDTWCTMLTYLSIYYCRKQRRISCRNSYLLIEDTSV